MGGSRALEDDAFDDVGDVFALVDGGLNDFEDFFPLDDLDGIFLFIEELGDEGAAEAVAVVFVAVDFDAVLESFLRRAQGANGQLNFGGGGNEDLDEVDGAGANGVHAVEDEAAGSGINEVNDIVKAAAELVDVFAIEGGDEGLIELGEEGVGELIAFMLDGFDDLHLLRDAGVMREHCQQGFGADVDIRSLFGEKVEEPRFVRHKPLQKSWHGV